MYEYILDTNNPDKELEYFWVTFKNSIMSSLSNEEKNEIVELSNKLNDLQSEERYDEIEKYIKNHIELIGYRYIIENNGYKARHICVNLNRWKKLTGRKLFNNKNVFNKIIRIYNNIYLKNKTDDHYNDIKLLLAKYSTDKNIIHLEKIMNISIEHKIYGIINKLKNILNIDDFINNEKKSKINKKLLKKSRAIKMIKYLVPKKHDL